MKYDDEGIVSEWNEAMFKMKRLHELQTEINRVKMNLLAKHPITRQWNYEVWFNSVLALYSEGQAKYKDEEIEEVDKYKNLIELLITTCSPHKKKISSSYSGKNKYHDIFSSENWVMLKKLIEALETKVKKYNDLHGLSTKNRESMDGRSILR